eukprot:gnl/MRDRNA2_/MRDRNA2_66839_c0_seq1.p1 gnl/MRDRNA2_/MRDRNA2_66839_c0~~gnl/MRDRNA2_/MRDRNA2_66839_c0_seq1.p1  ORF type:complete len:455 (+),score=66.05 gnl/MRDRNA2_/MRDRNA2_66839_c0_seq1:64-1365(+)
MARCCIENAPLPFTPAKMSRDAAKCDSWVHKMEVDRLMWHSSEVAGEPSKILIASKANWRPALELPADLTFLCQRQERQVSESFAWWNAGSKEVLGPLRSIMTSMAARFFTACSANQSLHIISLADGEFMHDTQVPTSALLAHAFKLAPGPWQEGTAKVHIVGADVLNDWDPWWKEQWRPSDLPDWIQLRSVFVDNLDDLRQQLFTVPEPNSNQEEFEKSNVDSWDPSADNMFPPMFPPPSVSGEEREGPQLNPEDQRGFDVVLVRHGLCFCDDVSFCEDPPPEVLVTGRGLDKVGAGMNGYYKILDGQKHEGRAAYMKTDGSSWAIRWHPDGAWMIDEKGLRPSCHLRTASVRCDVAHPAAIAQYNCVWDVWDGTRRYVPDPCITVKPSGEFFQLVRHSKSNLAPSRTHLLCWTYWQCAGNVLFDRPCGISA